MSKIGEIVFTDGGRVDILALVGYRSRTFVQVVTPIGLYAFSLRKNYIPGGYVVEEHRFSTVVLNVDSEGYFTKYDTVDVTDNIVEFRLFDYDYAENRVLGIKNDYQT